MRKMIFTHGSGNNTAWFRPFEGKNISIFAEVYKPNLLALPAHHYVNIPSVDRMTPTEAREFAAAILAACDWLDAQKGDAE